MIEVDAKRAALDDLVRTLHDALAKQDEQALAIHFASAWRDAASLPGQEHAPWRELHRIRTLASMVPLPDLT